MLLKNQVKIINLENEDYVLLNEYACKIPIVCNQEITVGEILDM